MNQTTFLKLLSDVPENLIFKGNSALIETPCIAIVGTRKPTAIGIQITTLITQFFVREGFTIVSGLARGIDTAAHKAALDAGGYTIAVLGTDLSKMYPPENEELAEKIVLQNGLLLTEYKTPKYAPKRFFERDRIQAGLSIAVVPIQADFNSGTMHTVKCALKYNRLLLCPKPIPEEAHLSQYNAIHTLIETNQAIPFTKDNYPDILEKIKLYEAKLNLELRKGINW